MKALADTSVFIGREVSRSSPAKAPDELLVSAITIGELRLGVLLAADLETRQRRLSTLQIATSIEPLAITDRVADAWAGLIAVLRAAGRRMPINDSWIAATALAHDLPVATYDRDFDDAPGVGVIAL